MENIYFDNAATSFPKAPNLSQTVSNFIENNSVNINRSVSSLSSSLYDIVLDTRVMLARFFDCDDDPLNFCKRIIFTSGVTQSINIFLRGLLNDGDHIITGSLEHHAVMRTLYDLKTKKNITFDIAKCDKNGVVSAQSVESLINKNTKAVIINHSSNVFGSISDIKKIGQVCKRHNIFFAVDTAQTAGVIPISFRKANIDFLAFSGHKGLLSLQGIGGFVISKRLSDILKPLVTGGTGSISHSFNQPKNLPDKFESGTLNLCGIVALNHSLKFINEIGIENIREKELFLRKYFVEKASALNGVCVYCADENIDTTSVVSLAFADFDNSYVADMLEKNYGIITRTGLHCAPSAHIAMGTFPQGTVRFSFSYFNSLKEIDYCVQALEKILKGE